MTRAFFAATASYRQANTAVFDFVTPTAVAMWNLRWQVQGFVAAVPDATKEELESRFIVGADMKQFDLRRANLRRAAMEHAWESHLQEFARVTLYSAISLYEGWLNEILAMCPGRRRDRERWAKELQQPSAGTGGRTERGIGEAVASLTAESSPAMIQAFHSVLSSQPKYAESAVLESLVTCYRYFKNVRNAFTHAGGRASGGLARLSEEMAGLAPTDLGMKVVPEHLPFLEGDEVAASLKGVVGLSDVICRMVTTVDARLAMTPVAERHLLGRWESALGRPWLRRDRVLREARVGKLLYGLGFPRPDRVALLEESLRREGLIQVKAS